MFPEEPNKNLFKMIIIAISSPFCMTFSYQKNTSDIKGTSRVYLKMQRGNAEHLKARYNIALSVFSFLAINQKFITTFFKIKTILLQSA